MKPDHPLPFINVRTQENRTPTGRRTSTPAKRAALYYAYGRDKEAQLEGKQRGQWLGPDGRSYTHDEVMAWVKASAMDHRYTFQGILSVPEGELNGAAFAQALQKGGQTDDWRLIAHEDTRHRHAHVLWFGDKRMDKQTFQQWQHDVRTELVRLEQHYLPAALDAAAQLAQQTDPEELAASGDAQWRRVKGQEVGFSW